MATPVKRATTAPVRRATAVGVPPATKLVFGVVFDLNGAKVPVSTADVADAITNGFEFTMPKPVDIGTIAQLGTWLNTQFGVPVVDPSTWPDVLKNVWNKAVSLDFGVEELHVKVPPKGSTDPIQFTFGMTGTWGDDPIVLGPLKIDGIFAGATNEPKKPAA
jgi:hypothetical protein